jgi:catechol 2,3-dioxygenase-like lactoylglutathione lyase family enzyme
MEQSPARLIALGARVHLFVRPDARDAFAALFRDVLGCRVVERDFGLEYPILLVSFEDGSAFSVEFTDLAPAAPDRAPMDDDHAFRGAWIEFRTRDLEGTLAALRAAGVPEFRHPGSPHAYFSAPGGQVFRILDADYRGP